MKRNLDRALRNKSVSDWIYPTFAILSYPLYFLQGLESYINNLPSKDELESLRVKLTQKTERNERLEAKIETLEGAHTGNSKLNYALQTQCKSLEEEVRLNQLY